MTTMKMLMVLLVAAILFCSHQHVVAARQVAVAAANNVNKLSQIFPCYVLWPYPWPRPYPCPPPRPRPRPRPGPRPRPCSPPPPPPPPPPSPPPPSPPPPPPSLPPPSPPPPPPSPPPPSPPLPPPSPPPPTPFPGCSTSDKEKVKKCMFNTTSIDACCPTFKSILGTKCPCYQYAEDLDNQVLITLEAYCDVDSPCGVPSPPPPTPFPGCSASDKEKVKKCMFNTTSIDECCPTFQSILGTSCPCYQYAEDLDNQVLITLEAYCDVDSPCHGVPSPPPPDPFSGCSASEKQQVKTCMFNTTSIDECCPTFQSILGTSCPCYKYAEYLDNQVLITLDAYCDVDSPCTGVRASNYAIQGGGVKMNFLVA